MLSRVQLCKSACRLTSLRLVQRNIGVSAPCAQKAAATGPLDPIQKLFIDKIHEYANKSKSSGGKLVDASPATEKSLKDELEKIARQYGAMGAEFSKFPTFNFSDVDLQAVGVQADIKQVAEGAEEAAEQKEEEEKAFYD